MTSDPVAPAPAMSAPASEAERLTLVVGRLNRRLQLATGGLSHGLLSAMSVIAKHGPLRLSDLAAFESVSPPSMTRTVAELESRGFVTRRPDPDDGRAVLVEAAQPGTEAVREARATRGQVIAELLDGLGADDRAQVLAALPALERLVDPS